MLADAEPTIVDLDFGNSFVVEIERIMEFVSRLPESWIATRYVADADLLVWEEAGSRVRLSAILAGCRQHGWPFVSYVSARQKDDPTAWPNDYAEAYLGWWPSRRAFAQEVATLSGHFIQDSLQLNESAIEEICSGFLCFDIDGQAIAFDLTPDL